MSDFTLPVRSCGPNEQNFHLMLKYRILRVSLFWIRANSMLIIQSTEDVAAFNINLKRCKTVEVLALYLPQSLISLSHRIDIHNELLKHFEFCHSSILLKLCKDTVLYRSTYWDEDNSHSIRTTFDSFKQVFLQIALLFLGSRLPWLQFLATGDIQWWLRCETFLCPGLVKSSDLWKCQTFWLLCSFISRATGAPSNKLHIKPFIVLILYFMTFIHLDSSFW